VLAALNNDGGMNDSRMRILHVVAGLAQSGGGLAEFVPRLALECARLGHSVTIGTVAHPAEPLSSAAVNAAAGGVRIVRFTPSTPRQIFFSWGLGHGLAGLVADADLVHAHSNWTFPVWWASLLTLRACKPLVMSPHGCLDPVRLAHSAWKKRLVRPIDTRCLRQADAIHATSEVERGWIEGFLHAHPPITVIPNGVDVDTFVRESKAGGGARQLLFLGRLHPLKGLDTLIDAWQLASNGLSASENWELVIAGPDEQGCRGRLERQAKERGLGNVRFSGPLYGVDKAKAMAQADLFVLPSLSENFGIAVAEALAAGVPVITTKGTPWHELEDSCGWWADLGVEPLANALAASMRLTDAERAAMGARGRRLVESKYRWASVSRTMERLYRQLLR
jgi:glycosyltransferase involved in cell wall biosynthesis